MDDPSLIMPQFMKDYFLGDDEINPLTGYSESFKRSLSPTSLALYEEFESASQNFETLKSEGKPLGDAIHHHYLSEQAFNDRQEDSFKNEARSQFYRAVKEGIVDNAEWAATNPLSAAYATGEMALSTAGAVMTGGRNVYEVAFHGKQLKSAVFETATAFALTKGAIKAYKGVSRLVARGSGVKKLSLVQTKGVSDAYRGLRGRNSIQNIIEQNTGLDRMSNRAKMFGTDRVAQFSNQRVRPINNRMPINSDYAGRVYRFDESYLENAIGKSMGTRDATVIRDCISNYRAQKLDVIPVKVIEKIEDIRTLQNKYPNGVPFTGVGSLDLTPYAREKVKITIIDGAAKDFAQANKIVGYKETPKGWTWHHADKLGNLHLVPADLHDAIRHTGGVAQYKELIKGTK